MDRTAPRRSRPARALRAGAPLLALVLLVGASAAGCADSGAHGTDAAMPEMAAPSAATGSGAIAQPAVPLGPMAMPTGEEVTAAWMARPDYVKALPAEWQSAYSFALARPDVLQWLPCYCGCEGIGHRSNLDCFFQRREAGPIQFEEHASFCDICVETANMASAMLREGKTMIQIRAAVDATFGGSAPGTDTELPPA